MNQQTPYAGQAPDKLYVLVQFFTICLTSFGAQPHLILRTMTSIHALGTVTTEPHHTG